MISNPIQFKSGETASIFAYGTGMTSGLTCTATKGSKVRTGVWSSQSRLPSGYTEVEYIQSSGTQYIDTGVALTSKNYEVDITATLLSLTSYDDGGGTRSDARYWANWSDSAEEVLTAKSNYVGFGSGVDTFAKYYTSPLNVRANIVCKRTSSNANITYNGVSTSISNTQTSTTNLSIYLFACHESDGTTCKSSLKYYSAKITDNGTVLRNFVPCINASNVVGMYDLVTRTFYGNSGTGTFTAGPAVTTTGYQISNIDEFGTWNVACTGFTSVDVNVDAVDTFSVQMQASGRLPSGYTEVEYIQSSGTQYINTGIIADANTTTDIVCRMDGSDLGACIMSAGGTYRVEYYSSPYLLQVLYNNGSAWSTAIKIGMALYTTYHFVMNDASHRWYINDSLETTATPVKYSSNTIKLFSGHDADSKSSATIWSCKIYQSGTIVREFVPCINPSNVVGMYDLVTSTFYGNSGSGVFIAGNPV